MWYIGLSLSDDGYLGLLVMLLWEGLCYCVYVDVLVFLVFLLVFGLVLGLVVKEGVLVVKSRRKVVKIEYFCMIGFWR